jgi:hypothetical protein
VSWLAYECVDGECLAFERMATFDPWGAVSWRVGVPRREKIMSRISEPWCMRLKRSERNLPDHAGL